jgi:hypothetical protein
MRRTLNRSTVALAALIGLAVAPAGLTAQQHEQHEDHYAEHHSGPEAAAVERAAFDYLEAFYEGDADKIRRSVHPEVVKYGFWSEDDGATYAGEPMSFQEMIDYANNVRERGSQPPASAPKEVHLLDVQDQTAAVKVVAWWGQDYLQLAKYDGQWKIVHVLWQTAPPM